MMLSILVTLLSLKMNRCKGYRPLRRISLRTMDRMSIRRCTSNPSLRRSAASLLRILNVSSGSFMVVTSVSIDALAAKVLQPCR